MKLKILDHVTSRTSIERWLSVKDYNKRKTLYYNIKVYIKNYNICLLYKIVNHKLYKSLS